MKSTNTKLSVENVGKRSFHSIILGIAVIFSQQVVNAASVDLGAASNFGILAGTGITNSGPTTIYGDMGTYPTPAITGYSEITLHGTDYTNDPKMTTVKNDLTTAYNDAASRPATTTYSNAVVMLGGRTLTAGVYKDPASSFDITGTLTLDGQGNTNAEWIFQAGSGLTAATYSNINLINGAQAQNVFWQIGSSADIKTGATLSGTFMALTSITMGTGATIEGALYARNGDVTLLSNTITNPNSIHTVPEPGSALLFISGMAALFVIRRRSIK